MSNYQGANSETGLFGQLFIFRSFQYVERKQNEHWKILFISNDNCHVASVGGYARGLAIDESENTYIVGYNYGTSGVPDPYTGGDAFASKFDSDGMMIWSTLLGPSVFDQGFSIALDGKGNVYAMGDSYAAWGNPVNNHTDGSDAFVAKLSNSGSLLWNTFLGAAGYDQGMGIATDGSENAYVTGYSCNTWGTPLHAHPGEDICVMFVAKLERPLMPTIAARFHENEIHGYGWPLEASVTLTIVDPDNATGTDYTDTRTVMVSESDPTQTFVQFPVWEDGFELENGQTVTMNDGITTKTLVVAAPIIKAIGHPTNTVEGTTEPYSEVWVDYLEATRHETADSNGHWLANFSVPGIEDFESQIININPYFEGEVRIQDEDGDSTAINWGLGLLMLELNSDGSPRDLYIRHWPGRLPVTLMIDNPATDQNPDYSDIQTILWSNGYSHRTMDWTGFVVQPDHTITVTDGNTARSMIVPLLRITGYDLTNDKISGISYPFATIRVPVSHPDGQEEVEPAVAADNEGNWLADFKDPVFIFDLQTGDCAEPQTYEADQDHTVMRDWCIPLDSTPPTITWTGNIQDGDSFYFGFVPPEPTCTASDDQTGVDGICTVSGYDPAIGSHILIATAKDQAGNQTTEYRHYTVSGWTLKGFYQPVDMNGIYNLVKGGSTVPIKFEIFAGDELTDTAYVKSLTPAQTSCSANAPVDEIEIVTTGVTSLRYDAQAGQFIYNWKSPKAPGQCYQITMVTADGSPLVTYFRLK